MPPSSVPQAEGQQTHPPCCDALTGPRAGRKFVDWLPPPFVRLFHAFSVFHVLLFPQQDLCLLERLVAFFKVRHDGLLTTSAALPSLPKGHHKSEALGGVAHVLVLGEDIIEEAVSPWLGA